MFAETILIWGGSSIAMYGVYLWGPTIVALLLQVSVPRAAAFFVFVSGAGVLGKTAVTLLAPALGRRPLGIVWGFGGAAALAAAGFENAEFVAGLPLIIVLLCAANFCVEGGFANLAPYTVERYGVSLGARASGLGQAANGFGKIIGPLSLLFYCWNEQSGDTTTDSGGGTSNIFVPCSLHGAGSAVVLVARCRNARKDNRDRCAEIDVRNKQ